MTSGSHARLRRLRCSQPEVCQWMNTCTHTLASLHQCRQYLNDSWVACLFAADNRVRDLYFDPVHASLAISDTKGGVRFMVSSMLVLLHFISGQGRVRYNYQCNPRIFFYIIPILLSIISDFATCFILAVKALKCRKVQ